MTKIVQGREITKFICFCVRSYYLCHYEYRKRLGIVKSKMQFQFCLCAHLSLYLQYARISRVGYEKRDWFYPTRFLLCMHNVQNIDTIWILYGLL